MSELQDEFRMEQIGVPVKDPLYEDLKEALAQAIEDKTFWRALTIRLFNRYVDPTALRDDVGDEHVIRQHHTK
jgi:hypothetical protein